MDFFSRSRYYNKNYGYPRTRDEGYFFSETVDNYEFTISEGFIEFRGYFRDRQSVYCVSNSVFSYCTSISNMHHVQSNEDC